MFSRARFKAFTLIELIAVVVVLGILAALAVPSFQAVKRTSMEQIVTRSAELVASNAKAQAAFEGTTLASTLDAAGLETEGYDSSTNTVSLTRDGRTVTAKIDESTGNVTILDGDLTGPISPVTYESGVDFETTFAVYGGSAGSAAGYSTMMYQVATISGLFDSLASAGQITVIVDNGIQTFQYTATITPGSTISLSPVLASFDYTSFQQNFAGMMLGVFEITVDESANTITLLV